VPINGNIGFSGSKLFSFTLPPGLNQGSYIDFQNPVNGGNGAIVAGGTSGGFNFIPQFDPGFIRDLATSANTLGYEVAPPETAISIDNFLSFASAPGLNIRLTKLPNATNCDANVICVGPFQLVQNGPAVSVSINVIGVVLSGGDSSAFTGQITAQFLGLSGQGTTVAEVLAEANSSQGALANSWSGAITASAIPEPGTVTMLGIGAIAMFLGRLRAKRRSINN